MTATDPAPVPARSDAAVDLYWLPLGAGRGGGERCVRWSGRRFETLAARREGRPPSNLFHAALEVRLGEERFTIEMAPAWSGGNHERGVVATGPVGLRWLGHSQWFRYEVRRWRGGTIPDIEEAVDSPRRVSADGERARQVLALAVVVPTLTWGRDEAATGDMWNSNSIVAWLLARSGHDLATLTPPSGGRAPGWMAGIVVAERHSASPEALGAR